MKIPLLVRGDIDGFFGLFIDNLLQLMLIAGLCTYACGLPADFVTTRILPAAAVSILLGNLFYTWQARRLMARTGRTDITALPFGINTLSLLAFVFFIMAPIYHETQNAHLAWQAGLFACLLSGLMETAGAFVGDYLRRYTPRAALLTALAGIAITFISMNFVFQIFAHPTIALLPMLLILITYAGRVRLPLGLPGGLVAVILGVAIAYGLRFAGYHPFEPGTAVYRFGFHAPRPAFADALALFASPQGWSYLAVIFPMGLFNVIGSLQNLESAAAAGDDFPTAPSLAVNGIATLLAAFLGSPFPTTIYIGHPGWKAMGARAGYSALNGIVITLLCLFGGVTLVLNYIPLDVTLGILLWIGIIITAQAFAEVPKSHGLAVALGLIPALAAWALFLVETTLRAAGASLYQTAEKFGDSLHIHGIIALSQGFLLTSMLLAAMLVHVIERKFLPAAAWSAAATLLSATGLIHAYTLTPAGIQNHFISLQISPPPSLHLAAPAFTLIYTLTTLLLLLLHLHTTRHPTTIAH